MNMGKDAFGPQSFDDQAAGFFDFSGIQLNDVKVPCAICVFGARRRSYRRMTGKRAIVKVRNLSPARKKLWKFFNLACAQRTLDV